ncbi:sensor histidine kinase [Thalassomonas actiniarum]|uniref:histidine kinase n=1 Tax=Thalassomonas actiniarum TaxID=485447 RepID=A0AAF0C439_9GAMM|nr:ATP-binding protein [Thalassomonas actiniarum]WDD99533.1 sensor histidine kinase [Thalassomonas actiniarum]
MTSSAKIKSIQRHLLFLITGGVCLIQIIGISFIAMTFVDNAQQNIELESQYSAETIASRSISYLEANDHDGLHDLLLDIKNIPYINYVHIYRLQDDSEEIEFFTSYNRDENFPAIPDKIGEIDKLTTTNYTENFLELIIPIKKQKIYGYLYIQSSTEQVKEIIQKTIIIAAIVFTVSLCFTLLIIIRVHRMITVPIKSLIGTVQDISQHKNYTLRCQDMPYQELDILSRNLNIMLSRTSKHITKQDNAEQQILKLNHELEDKVSQRTEALKESNQELLSTLEKLHQFQGQLVESEKMASLGDMVAGVAHEVNTPIGLGVTASTLLSDRLNAIKDAFENKTLKSSQLKKFLNEGQENVAIVYRNLNRAADLISSFKRVAVDQSSEQDRTFNVKELINEVFLTLAPQIKQKPFELELNCPGDLVVISKPGPINQILINLIVNSILHGFEGKDDGVISITVMNLSGQLHINYRDNGTGVSQSIKGKIFDPFITTKRGAGGSGLGLHLVYNLVTQALGGSIQFESEINKGVSFDIHFPVVKSAS